MAFAWLLGALCFLPVRALKLAPAFREGAADVDLVSKDCWTQARDLEPGKMELAFLNCSGYRLLSTAPIGATFDAQTNQIRSVSITSSNSFVTKMRDEFPGAICVERTSFLKASFPKPVIPQLDDTEVLMALNSTCHPQGNCNAVHAIRALLDVRKTGEDSNILAALDDTRQGAPGICMFSSAFIAADGQTCSDRACVLHSGCHGDGNPLTFHHRIHMVKTNNNQFQKRVKPLPTHDTVYVISQFYGNSFYHTLVENFPRLLLGLDLLLNRPDVKVHAQQSGIMSNLFSMVGINSEQLITGPVNARVVYVPEPVACFTPAYMMMNVARFLLLPIIQAPAPAPRKQITVIRRHGSRELTNHDELVKELERSFASHAVSVFDQDAITAGNVSYVTVSGKRRRVILHDLAAESRATSDTLRLFSSSDVIVAPHGAGLANIMTCSPGTIVIENLPCQHDSRESVNFCFSKLSSDLSLRYHALADPTATRASSMTIDVGKVISILKAEGVR